MASSYSISGLASGLDWQSMITQLVELERRPITLLEENKDTLGEKKSAWSEVNTKLLSLKTAAGSLSSMDDFDVFSASATVTGTSRDVEDLLSYAVGSNASEGSYDIVVDRLATAEKMASESFGSTNDALGMSGDLTINERTVSIASTDSLADIQRKINALNSGDDPADVTASIISLSGSEYRLTLTSKNTGADGMDITDGTGSLGLTQLVAGQDSQIRVDGYTVTRATNQISDVISGVTLNLAGEDALGEDSTITLTVGRDRDGVKEKIQGFVDSYNELMSYIAKQNTASGDGKASGALFADSSLQTIKSTLRRTILSGVSGLDSTLDHLSLVGINIDKTGQLSIDGKKLDGYLKSNFEDVVNLFAAGGSSSSGELSYISSGEDLAEGDYTVTVTQAATKAIALGSGFSGTLAGNANLTLTSSGGSTQTIALAAGSDIDDIVDAINSDNTLGLVAGKVGNELRITSSSYGSSGSFTLSSDNAELGFGTGTVSADALDVAGTITNSETGEAFTVTGSGQVLIAKNGEGHEALRVRYTGAGAGAFDFSFTMGIGEKLDREIFSMSDTIDGYVANKQTSLQNQMDSIDKKIEKMEARLAKYQETLAAKYSAMESLLSTLQSQQSWLTSQLSSLDS